MSNMTSLCLPQFQITISLQKILMPPPCYQQRRTYDPTTITGRNDSEDMIMTTMLVSFCVSSMTMFGAGRFSEQGVWLQDDSVKPMGLGEEPES